MKLLTKFLALLLAGLLAATSTQAATTVTYFHNDPSGTPVLATNAAGAEVWRETYRPYGERLNLEDDSKNNKVWFHGKPYDTATGLTYMGARYYHPAVGRFMGIDPAPVVPDELNSFNRYAYANNNPYRFVDPDGHSPIDVAFLAWDIGKLGLAMYTGVGVGAAFADVAASTVGVFSPIPFTGQAIKTARAAEHAIEAVRAADHVVDAAKTAKAGKNFAGKQTRDQRLRDLATDDKVSSADRGWIKQEINEVAAGKKGHLRNPPGKDLAHERGRENAKGYGYEHAHLQNRADHKAQHKLDNWGRKNSERPLP